MKMAHLLLEMYCNHVENPEGSCSYNMVRMGIHCFENKCKFLNYTYCPNELAYSGAEGLVSGEDSSVGFGGEMDAELNSNNYETKRQTYLERWEKICQEKINEAYESYMDQKE